MQPIGLIPYKIMQTSALQGEVSALGSLSEKWDGLHCHPAITE